MAGAKFPSFDTLALHAGQVPDPVTGSRAVPIYQTTSYVFQDADHAAALFNLERPGYIYSRIGNPTVSVLEERVAALDGGVAAVGTASGHAALFLAIATLMGQGGHIVASSALYGGSLNLFAHTLPRFGIETTLVDPRDSEAFRAAIRPETRLLFTEFVGNPGLEVADIPALAEIAHSHGIPLAVDNTFLTPWLSRPLDLGADLIVHSATKWLGGHGLAIGGILVDGGRFDWEASGKFPTLTEPYEGYHGINYAEEFGPSAFAMRARTEGLRDFGAVMAPQTAFYLLQGVETLPLRMERHMVNTHKVLAFLESSDDVAWVSHPSLPSHPDHARAQSLLPKGAGSIVSFGVKGGREGGRVFIESCKLASHLANVGDAKTLIIHPASTTHSQLDAESLKRAGVGEDMIRLSVGLEDAGDIIDDLKQALRAARKAVSA
ncbi:O-acetylhomoserine aminocarboxypropyltransferase [Aquibaculum sediminis]|uniref:O-acetylhomoserine aminocarboxypropyltransferase n=1 Tax=Aquibaculum sediminis TaxID=3231907 RepID=UPI0034529090